MKINELFKKKKVVYSFEIFPPKVNDGIDKILNTLDSIRDCQKQLRYRTSRASYLREFYSRRSREGDRRTCGYRSGKRACA